MTREVRASVVISPCRSEVRTFDAPEITPDSGLLKVEACGVCGSDVSAYRQTGQPRILGHESVGVIEGIGSTASTRWGVADGDRVVLEEYLPCGHCPFCRTTEFRLCQESDARRPGALRYGSTGIATPPSLWGGFSQYLYLHPRSVLHRVPLDIPAPLLTLALPIGNGYEWACILGGTRPGRAVAVIGAGQQGLGCVLAAKAAGADVVIAVGRMRDHRRLELAGRLGADHTVDVDTDEAVSAVRDLTDGQGVDVVIDAAAGDQATVGTAIEMARVGGTVVLGAATGVVDQVPIGRIRQKYLTVRGARGHSFGSVEWAIGIIVAGQYPLDEMTTRRYGLGDVDSAIRATAGEQGTDVVHVTVDPWTGD